MFESLFKKFAKPTEKLSSLEMQDLISRFLLHMVWTDGRAGQKELDLVVKILTHDFHVDPDLVIREINNFNPSKQDMDAIADALRENLPVTERIQLLRDIWAIALTHEGKLNYEEEMFYLAAEHLDIPANHFLEHCVKVMPRNRQ